jgi:DNA-binding HxlR family transcriptional regulator
VTERRPAPRPAPGAVPPPPGAPASVQDGPGAAAGTAGPVDADEARARQLAHEVFAGVTGKWRLPVVEVLDGRTLRFTALRAEVAGISHKVLTQTLRGLERDGLVERTVHPTIPPRVEYRLTEAGRALRTTLGPMCSWARRYRQRVEEARDRFDAARAEEA